MLETNPNEILNQTKSKTVISLENRPSLANKYFIPIVIIRSKVLKHRKVYNIHLPYEFIYLFTDMYIAIL